MEMFFNFVHYSTGSKEFKDEVIDPYYVPVLI